MVHVTPSSTYRGSVISLDKLSLFHVRRAEVKLSGVRHRAKAPHGQYCLDVGNVLPILPPDHLDCKL
jgi:hypothetical protein